MLLHCFNLSFLTAIYLSDSLQLIPEMLQKHYSWVYYLPIYIINNSILHEVLQN